MDENTAKSKPGARAKTRIFLSYSRADGAFTQQLVGALKGRDFEVFQDIEDILPSEAWRNRIASLIGQSDTVVFVISPDAVASKVCQWELHTAQALSKRLVPILYRGVPIAEIPEQAAQINFIFFNDPAGFDAAFGRLAAALDTDIGWLREHTTIGELARRWDKQGRRRSMLLRGKDIREAQHWLERRPNLAPEADELQRLFIKSSRKSERNRKRIAALGAVLAAAAVAGVPVVFYPNQTYVALNALAAVQQVRAAEPQQIPLEEASRARLRTTIEVLATMLGEHAVSKLAAKDPMFNPWAVAQTSVAVKGLRTLDLPSIAGYFAGQMNPRCGCWQELAEKQPHTGASGWVLYAIGEAGQAAPPPAIDYFLGLQNGDGWWPLHPTTAAAANASTYATAWALLGLTGQMDKITDPALKGRLATAIAAGMRWLQAARLRDRASWKDYPAAGEGRESIGVSGLALHVLHRGQTAGEIADIDRLWLERLPVDELEADAGDLTNVTITLKSGSPDFDRTRNYRLPWALIATADAYAHGSTMQRARVVAWLQLVLRRNLVTEPVLRQNWVAAELLVALRHVERQLR